MEVLYRYLNDPDALTKLGQAVGIGASGAFPILTDEEEVTAVVEYDEQEDESSIHYLASVGRVEVSLHAIPKYQIFLFTSLNTLYLYH